MTMSRYIILAETGADVPKEMAERYGIYIIPMHVTFGEESRDDGSFPTTELFAYYKSTGKLPKTAAANVAEFSEIYDRIHEEHPEAHIIYLAYSAVTTSTYQCGVIAAQDRDYVTTFDTKHVSAGQCMVVYQVARYIEEHPDASLDQVMAQAAYYSQHTRMGFFPGDLDYLRAGGRVSNAAYLGAKLLSLNPLIEIQDGYLIATKKYRGKMNRIAGKLLTDFTAEQKLKKDTLFLVFSAGLSESLKESLVAEAREMGYQEIRWIETGCVVSTHSGPGAYGVVGVTE